MSIEVLSAGLSTQIQDMGRPHLRHLGVPHGGAADYLSLALANYCAGNPHNCAGLEITLSGPTLRFDKPTIIALCGADIDAKLDEVDIEINKAISVKAGQILSLGRVLTGMRSYLAVAGGIDCKAVLGSQGLYETGKFGGGFGRTVARGDMIAVKSFQPNPKALPIGAAAKISQHHILRCIKGPEFHHLDEISRLTFGSQNFQVSSQTNRMGLRLNGQPLILEQTSSMTSSPILPGTVQCPPSGQLIIAAIDGHCIGGYARIGQIIRADRHLIAQIGPHHRVSFQTINQREAQKILKQKSIFYQSFMPEFSF